MHDIVLHSIVLLRSLLYCIVNVLLGDIIQYNTMHKFVGVLDNPLRCGQNNYVETYSSSNAAVRDTEEREQIYKLL